MCKHWEGNKFSFPIGIDSIYAYVLLSIYTPFPCTHTSWKVCDLVYDVFFLYPENLGTIKYFKLTTFFILFVPQSYPPRKKLVATALYGNLEIDFTINLNKYFRTVINTFKVALFFLFFLISTHCKAGSIHAVAMPLHQTDCFTCFYSCIKF